MYSCRLIKLSIFRYSVILLAISATETSAQTQSVSQWATVSFNVKSAIELKVNRNLAFGYVIQGETTVSVDPIAGGSLAAYFSLNGPPDTFVTVTFSSSPLTDGQNAIPFSGLLAANSNPDQIGGVPIKSGSTITTGATGEYNFWAGGTATLSPSQPLGVYTGSFTLSIAY